MEKQSLNGNAAARYYHLLHELVNHIGMTEANKAEAEGIEAEDWPCLICSQNQDVCTCIMQEVMDALGCPSHLYPVEMCYL